jgi:hypothetical protein
MKTILLLLSALLLTVSAGLPVRADEDAGNDRPTIALVNRVVQIVERRTPQIDWREARIGDLLNSGDVVKTGPASFSLIRFYDNSLLRIRELSEVIVFADRDREAYHRNIQLEQGSVGFDVRKQDADRFEFSTPTSVASIRGSRGTFTVASGMPDVLLMATGNAVLRNVLSGNEIEVTGGEIGFSFTDGSLEKRDITPEDEEQYGEGAGDREGTNDRAPVRERNVLEIRTQDEDGNERTIIIEYEEDKTEE